MPGPFKDFFGGVGGAYLLSSVLVIVVTVLSLTPYKVHSFHTHLGHLVHPQPFTNIRVCVSRIPYPSQFSLGFRLLCFMLGCLHTPQIISAAPDCMSSLPTPAPVSSSSDLVGGTSLDKSSKLDTLRVILDLFFPSYSDPINCQVQVGFFLPPTYFF